MTPGEFAEIEARATAATPGPWAVTDGDWAVISSGPHSVIHAYRAHSADCPECEDDAEVSISIEDAEFIAHAREDIPALLAAVRERDNTIARVREVLDDYDGLDAEPIPKLSTHAWMHEVRAALGPQETP